jgi:hypothetical protein
VKGEQPGIVGPAAVGATCVASAQLQRVWGRQMLQPTGFPEGVSSAQSAAPGENNNTRPVNRRATSKVAHGTASNFERRSSVRSCPAPGCSAPPFDAKPCVRSEMRCCRIMPECVVSQLAALPAASANNVAPTSLARRDGSVESTGSTAHTLTTRQE